MFHVRVVSGFSDGITGVVRKIGDTYDIDDIVRLKYLLGDNERKRKMVEILWAKKRKSTKYEGPSICIAHKAILPIGGIETWLYNFTKHYKDRNITVIAQRIDDEQFIRISEYADVYIDTPNIRIFDTLILDNYDGADLYLNHIRATNIYQMINADMSAMREILPMSAQLLTYRRSPKIKKVICVSDTCKKGLTECKDEYKTVIYNMLEDDIKDEGLVLASFCRLTKEKGGWRILELARKFKAAGKHFIWFLCCPKEQIRDPQLLQALESMSEFVFIKPSNYNKILMRGCDYIVQLSDTESFCYTAYEALQRGIPVLLTDYPEATNTIIDGVNGYIIKRDLSNVNIDKIFNQKPTNVTFEDKCDYDKWEQVFKGEL